MNRFDEYKRLFGNVDGWFDDVAACVFDCLLDYQEEEKISGDFLEIGIWKGKSAGLAALHCQPEEKCLFIDALSLEEAKENVSKAVPGATCEYLQEFSQCLARYPFLNERVRTFRWIHVDGEHTSQAVVNDLDVVDRLLSGRGVVVVDDFFANSYPQVTQGVFQFLASRPSRLTLFLCGFRKGYLCRPRAAREYLQYVHNSLHADVTARGCEELTLWKTTEPADMNTFGITPGYRGLKYRGPDWDDKNIHI